MTDEYFGKMGLRVRYFMPAGSSAPLAFYFRGDLLNDYSHLQLIGTINTMETFQKIYRPEIYGANVPAAPTSTDRAWRGRTSRRRRSLTIAWSAASSRSRRDDTRRSTS